MSQKIRAMVVDDSAVIRGLFERALKADGTIEVIGTAANGQIAINMLKNVQVDVLVLDIEMPVMNGLKLNAHSVPPAARSRMLSGGQLGNGNPPENPGEVPARET